MRKRSAGAVSGGGCSDRASSSLAAIASALSTGDLAAAENLLDQLMATAGDRPPALSYLRARLYCGKGQHVAALDLLEASQATGETAEGCYLLGVCWQHLREWKLSEQALRRAIALDYWHTDAHILLGVSLRHLGRKLEALRCFEQALAGDPRALLARLYLSELCAETRDFKRALVQLHVLLGFAPDYVPAHRQRAANLFTLGDQQQAMNELRWLVQRGEADAWCFHTLGSIYQACGEPLQALRAFEYALRLEPARIESIASAAQLSAELGQLSDATTLYRSLLDEPLWEKLATQALAHIAQQRSNPGTAVASAPELPPFTGFAVPRAFLAAPTVNNLTNDTWARAGTTRSVISGQTIDWRQQQKVTRILTVARQITQQLTGRLGKQHIFTTLLVSWGKKLLASRRASAKTRDLKPKQEEDV
ncbi:MAG: hypothetical protein HY692_08125 [Cyanobacteria bacterium NC_groundwater_1444_Ag_S-0.65um_54_12]|nr:hypothetical protein [Cyanobacteria bacterium NC_groundwater_1444_Ag_S-0.65um_54_12]